MRKAIAGVLMGAAVLSLAACGKSDTAQTTAAQAAESADSTAAAVDTEDKKEIVYGKSRGRTQSSLRLPSFRFLKKRDTP